MAPSKIATNEGIERVDAFDQVAESFLERVRRGERPSISDYLARYPELAEQIRELLPLLVEMELAKSVGVAAETGSYASDAADAGEVSRQLGNFRILGRLGDGGMGVVYEAIQEGLGRHVALKVIRPEFLADPSFLQRFRHEAQAAAKLHHPHIVPVFDAGTHDGVPFFAMQFISGQSLDAILHEVKRLRGVKVGVPAAGAPNGPDALHDPAGVTATSMAERLLTGRFERRAPDEPTAHAQGSQKPATETEASDASATPLSDRDQGEYYRVVARLGAQVAGALGYAHKQGILHRDIKPSNLLIGLDGHVWVADFGLAKVVESDDASRSQDLAGTPRYMAPERFEGWSDRRSDVYALGVTLYEMATLSPAFPARDRAQLIHQILHEDPAHPRRLDRRVPRDLETIIRKTMAREPAERYVSADHLAEDLENFLAHRPIRARRNTLSERAWKWCRRKPALAGLWIVLALGLAATSWQWWRAERSLDRTNRMAMGLSLDRALGFCQQGEPARGMLHMVDLLSSAPSAAPEYEHAIRANLTAWARRLARPKGMRRLAAPPASRRHFTDLNNQAMVFRKKTALVNTLRGVQVWDLDRFEPTGIVLADGQETISIALLADAKVAVTIDSAGCVRRWDVGTGMSLGASLTCRDENLVLRPRSPSTYSSILSSDGSIAAMFADHYVFRLWDVVAGSPIGAPITVAKGNGEAAFGPDGKTFARFDGVAMYERWETATGRRLASHPLPSGLSMMAGIVVSPDGKVLATGAEHQTQQGCMVRLWDAETGVLSASRLIHPTRVNSLCFSPDGRTLATLDDDGANRFWDSSTGGRIGEPFWQRSGGTGCALAVVDGRRYFSIDNHTINHFCLVSWDLPSPLEGERCPDRTVQPQPPLARSEDGKLAVAVANDGRIVVRDAESMQPIGREMRHRDAVLAVAICSDGRTLATGGADATAQLWNLRSGQSIGPSLAHRGAVRSVAFRGDGLVLATGSDDGTARLWDSATGTAIGPPLPHSAPVEIVAFDDDGSLLTQERDGVVRRWVLPRAATGNVDRVFLWVQALSGAELSAEGVIRKVSNDPASPTGVNSRWDEILAVRERGVAPEP